MRRFAWPVIFFQVLWFNIVVPGHTRGIVTVPDGKNRCAVQAAAPSCCGGGATGKDGKPDPERAKHCAICYVASTYAVPVVYDIDLKPSGLVDYIDLEFAGQLARLACSNPFWPTGPPLFG